MVWWGSRAADGGEAVKRMACHRKVLGSNPSCGTWDDNQSRESDYLMIAVSRWAKRFDSVALEDRAAKVKVIPASDPSES